MGYVTEIETQIIKRDFAKLLLLWEEYCSDDNVDAEELIKILECIKRSDFAEPFGKYVDRGLVLWENVKDPDEKYKVLKLIVDLQTTNTMDFAKMAFEALEKKYHDDPEFEERIRLIGLRSKTDFQGAISNYDLLHHMAVGKCVFHTGGWGTGEIMEISPIREQLLIEFEYLAGKKHLTYQNAFKNLIPLPDDHFLARRFLDPDALEEEAKKNPVKLMKILLRDLGPVSASEIKDALCELVIPEEDWAKWWQNARIKLKKDTLIKVPSTQKEVFILRKKEVSHEERFAVDILKAKEPSEIIQTAYNYVRDFPNILRNKEIKKNIQDKLLELLSQKNLPTSLELQVYIFLENILTNSEGEKSIKEIIVCNPNIKKLVDEIDIIAFKKRALVAIREYREDWPQLFLGFLFSIQQSQLRDYILKELTTEEHKDLLKKELETLLNKPTLSPETVVWYFQKITADSKEEIPFADKEGQCRFFESFLILLHTIEHDPEYRDLTKKMHVILTNKRYMLVRNIIEGTSLEFIKEFLLLTSKCHTFTDHDLKILQSLAQVVQPSLTPVRKTEDRLKLDGTIIWTTEEGYRKTQERAQRIGTIEIVENAKEVEAARALGDLRENSEYKFAVEKRRHLQGELKKLSEGLNRARLITVEDVDTHEASIGTVVTVQNPQGESETFTILGPWDADAEKNILSFQSKFAQAMLGKKVNDSFDFREDQYKVLEIKSYLDVSR